LFHEINLTKSLMVSNYDYFDLARLRIGSKRRLNPITCLNP